MENIKGNRLLVQENGLAVIAQERYEQLIEAEVRLKMLCRDRIIELQGNNYVTVRNSDIIMGDVVVDAVINRKIELDKEKEGQQ